MSGGGNGIYGKCPGGKHLLLLGKVATLSSFMRHWRNVHKD